MAARLSQAEKNRRRLEREKQKRAVAKAREKLKKAKARLALLSKKAVPIVKMERHTAQIEVARKLVELAEANVRLAQAKPTKMPELEELPGPSFEDFPEDLPGPGDLPGGAQLPGPSAEEWGNAFEAILNTELEERGLTTEIPHGDIYDLFRRGLTPREAVDEVLKALSIMTSPEERAVVNAVDNYRKLLKTGMASHGGTFMRIDDVHSGPDYDMVSSSRGAVMVDTANTRGTLLRSENVEEIMYLTRNSIRTASLWGDPIYAVIHMYQPEPTYEMKTDIGRAGGKPDGWIWEHPTDMKQKLFSTWQGVSATTDPAALEDALERHLEDMVRANGSKNVAIVHKIEIRSVPSNEVKKR